MNARLFTTIRKVNGLSQHEMAERLQVSPSLVAKIETGERRCLSKLAEKVVEEFGAEHISKVAELTKLN
ncbi:helix-turn-helix transcriptional regulator [Bacillus sp. V3B]|uniref:helix-turn-helix domain-containing protein n=1 Tax=Bacillus sp. V3B TaxID=2804915 RepID=UPI00210A2D61|nr:helix-turn-helix transcriptional regulator [Bacillus sp. V3B]MCQ6274732.1 helix-turn-helix transcriptional regulator [Bacillus sp. V3B]